MYFHDVYRKENNKHELELQKISLKADRNRIELARIDGNIKIESDTINADNMALIEATKAQSAKSGKMDRRFEFSHKTPNYYPMGYFVLSTSQDV
ncbi:hypothetical protein [Candidatus Liberibacter sp.]|uniref:hypothetical protein n=1 Tax=Candidatus Liberibacter sp. TaxID=34022 RepID=UPI0015F4B395|nr:hypothetical protein [Candidatus Liberibacter sp.]MBA5723751.1 hypothetical protein [Candidatus Liberibacter sp.]